MLLETTNFIWQTSEAIIVSSQSVSCLP